MCTCLENFLLQNLKWNHLTLVCNVIPALPFCVSTVRLKLTVPMSCRLGTVMLTHSSTCPSPSLTVYMRLSNPTVTTVRTATNKRVSWHTWATGPLTLLKGTNKVMCMCACFKEKYYKVYVARVALVEDVCENCSCKQAVCTNIYSKMQNWRHSMRAKAL